MAEGASAFRADWRRIVDVKNASSVLFGMFWSVSLLCREAKFGLGSIWGACLWGAAGGLRRGGVLEVGDGGLC